MRKKTIRSIVSALCVIAFGATGGCGGMSHNKSFEEEKRTAERYPSLVSDWKGSLQNDDLSDFERDVLERAVSTGSITQDDYEQAYTKYLQCMTNAGYDQLKYTKMPDGLYRLSNDATTDEGYFDQSVQCSDGTIRVIEAAYRDQQDNPERYKDSGIIAAQCLRDAKIVDDTYTAAQFNEASQRYLNGDETDPSDLFGFPITGSNQQTLYCLALGGVGLAIEDDDAS